MADQPAKKQSPRLSRRVLVTIVRDMMDQPVRAVWQHELPILEHIFGEGAIKPVDTATLDEGYTPRATADLKPFNKTQEDFLPPSQTLQIGFVFVGNPNAEFQRLIQVYGRDKDENVSNAEKVFGRFSTGEFASLLGQPTLEDLPPEQLRAILREYGYLQAVPYDADDTEKRAESEKTAKFMKMPKPELLKLATEIGVSLH